MSARCFFNVPNPGIVDGGYPSFAMLVNRKFVFPPFFEKIAFR